jgi:hypothetical protein
MQAVEKTTARNVKRSDVLGMRRRSGQALASSAERETAEQLPVAVGSSALDDKERASAAAGR